jgi:predicted GTPase
MALTCIKKYLKPPDLSKCRHVLKRPESMNTSGNIHLSPAGEWQAAGASTKPDLEALHNYTQNKLALADQLRMIRQGLKALGRENAEQQCGELMVKLAEDRFVLAVLGQFKRGKSSLMNAIIGKELLPTGVLPLTSAITILKYGPTERMLVHRNDSGFDEELPLSDLPGFVTEKGNPGNGKNVKTVRLELPVPFLQRGVEFVDTPGVGSGITVNTATTYSFLPECDAVLFVTGVDAPMTSLELSFLKEIRQYVNRIFFIVNKIDLAQGEQRKEVLEFINQAIREQTGQEEIKVFPVSSGQALAAKISGDDALYEQSGLKALENVLASFLSGEKSVSLLATIALRALRLLDAEEAPGIFQETSLKLRATGTQIEKSHTIQVDPQAAAVALAEAHARLEVLYQDMMDGRQTGPVEKSGGPSAKRKAISGTAFPAGPLNLVALSKTDPVPEEIAADLQARTCPVCRHLSRQASGFFSHWQYRLVTEEQAQAEFAANLGFCPLHTWQLLAISSPYGASVGYASLAAEAGRRIQEESDAFSGGDKIMQLVHNSHNCPVCKLLRGEEKKYIALLGELISHPSGRDAYRHSQGACLWHLGMLLNATPSGEDQQFLLAHAVQLFRQDAEDMRTYAMKRDALRRALQNRNEEDAYRRAVTRIVGDRSVCMPWAGESDFAG